MSSDPFAVIFQSNFETPSLNDFSFSFYSSLSSLPTLEETSLFSLEKNQKLSLLQSRPVGRKPNNIKNKEKHFPFLLDCHDNKKEDNMIKKIKPHYHRFLLKYINNCIKKLGMKTFLKKLEGKFNSNTSTSQNKLLLETPLLHVLSENISERFLNFNKDYNKNVLISLTEENEYLKGLLELTYEYVYTNVFIKECSEVHKLCYDNVYIEYFKNEIPKEFLFEKLVHKQEKSLQRTLDVFGKEGFVWKISNSTSRIRKNKKE